MLIASMRQASTYTRCSARLKLTMEYSSTSTPITLIVEPASPAGT